MRLPWVVASDTWLREHPPVIEVPVIHQVLEPVNLPLEHPAVIKLAAAYREALGTDPEFGSLPGPCDANIMSEAGITTVVFGPGDLAMNAHGTNEYVPVQQVIDACKVYAGLMVDCCGEIAEKWMNGTSAYRQHTASRGRAKLLRRNGQYPHGGIT